MSDVGQPETLDLRGAARPTRPARSSLVVFEGESTRMFVLPAAGEVVVGRGDGAGLRIDDPSISRAHARLVVQPGGVQLVDLGSRNGVLINDRRITGSEPLRSGDVVTLGTIALVFHTDARGGGAPGLLAEEDFFAKVAQEVERAIRYQRPLAVVAFALGAGAEPAAARRVVEGSLRTIDVGAVLAEQLTAALPEAELAHAERFATETIAALAERGVAARAGVAVCPIDGADAATLCASARGAAVAAADGQLCRAVDNVRVLTLGAHQALLADPVMVRLYALAERLAASSLPVLIRGETGTGKELLALAVHHCSPRTSSRLMTINCAALPEPLAESALFGHEQGAFTGATEARPGLLEAASGGTVFFDEVGELSPAVQAKLLRALETGRITRVGATAERRIDVRFVAATHRDLEADIKTGRFREDLFFRLAGAVLVVPPLRERPRELPLLARRFLDEACAAAGRSPLGLTAPAFAALAAHAWPGNVRELKSTMAFLAASVLADAVEARHVGERITPDTHRRIPAAQAQDFLPLAEQVRALEKAQMRRALDATGWNKTRAAAALAMPLRTFVTKVRQFGLTR